MSNGIKAVWFGLILIMFAPFGPVSRASSINQSSAFAPAAVQKGKISDPAEAARRLYNAWRRKNRRAALNVASPKVVDKLFSVRPMLMKFNACESSNETFSCVYHNANLNLDMSIDVIGGVSAGYHVERVSFSSED